MPPMPISISSIHGREVLDSRGNPTVEVEVTLSDGAWGRAIVPSGASKGQRESLELRDGDKNRYLGKGTLTAVKTINETIAKIVVGKPVDGIQTLDGWMLEVDGTAQKSKLGANSILGVSLAFAQATAVSRKVPLFVVIQDWMGTADRDLSLPIPMMNILNGGLHANNGLAIQEFMIFPHGFSRFSEALRAGAEVFQHLKEKLARKHLSTAVGDEGGFAPVLKSNQEALELILQAVEEAGYEPGKQISLALDVASSSFFDEATGKYTFDGRAIDRTQLLDIYGDLLKKFPLVSIEDGLEENDWGGWTEMTARFGKHTQLVGDDLFVTQVQYVKRGIEEKAANSVLIKVNQVGSLSETIHTMKLCKQAGFTAVTSHRSGETEDTTIAHLAVGSGCGQIKTGSLSRSERTAKYNELLRIEEWGERNRRPIAYAKAPKF